MLVVFPQQHSRSSLNKNEGKVNSSQQPVRVESLLNETKMETNIHCSIILAKIINIISIEIKIKMLSVKFLFNF